jgi:F420-dependent oxidoreductase-like protein
MKIGLQISSFTWPGGPSQLAPVLERIGQSADEAGFSSLWVMDHFFQIQMIGKADEPMLEGHSALNFLAALTKRVRLGTLVSGVVYRHPAILVKSVTTLDVLSGGRAYFGIGAAWYEREAVGLGIPFPPRKERFERLEESLQIALHMWSGQRTAWRGKHYQLEEPLNSPQPLSKPHPPILVGGVGEKKTLRLVAKYADACNLYALDGADVVRAKLEVLRRHCEEIGRPFDEIERTALGAIDVGPDGMSPREVIEYCRSMRDAGIQHLIVSLARVHEITPIETMGNEVIPAISDL